MKDLQKLSEKLGDDGQISTGNQDDGTWSEVKPPALEEVMPNVFDHANQIDKLDAIAEFEVKPKEVVSGREIVHELTLDNELSIVVTEQRNQYDPDQTRYCTHVRVQQEGQDYTVSGNYDMTLFDAKEDAKRRYYSKGGK